MAIHPDHPGLTVEFVVDGSMVKEYDDDQPVTPNTVTKYVEAVSDATFAIKYRITDPFPIEYGLGIEVCLDGQKVFSSVISKDKIRNSDDRWCNGAHSWVSGKRFMQKFRFSQFSTDRDSNTISDTDLVSRLTSAGQISFALRHINNMKSRLSKKRNKPHKFTIGNNQVPQKMVIKIGLSHQGSLDKPQPVYGGRCWDYDYVDKAGDPFISFTFKYRSLETLKSLGIIHRKPSPTPENTPDLVDDDLVVLNEQPAQIDNKHTMADKKPVNINKYSNPAAKKRTQDLSREEMMVLLDYYRNKEATPTPTVKQELVPGPKINREVKVKRELPDNDGDNDQQSRKHFRIQPTKAHVVIELD